MMPYSLRRPWSLMSSMLRRAYQPLQLSPPTTICSLLPAVKTWLLTILLRIHNGFPALVFALKEPADQAGSLSVILKA